MAKVIRSRRDDAEFREAIPAAQSRPAYVRSQEPAVIVRPDRLARFVYAVTGILEALLVFRLFLRLFGVGYEVGVVRAIYDASQILIQPFLGLFPGTAAYLAVQPGIELATVFSIVFYAVGAYVVVSIIRVIRGW